MTTDIHEIPLHEIRTDGGTQARVALNEQTVADYAAAMASGEQFPPVQVMYDGGIYWLVDGHHRLAAYRIVGKGTVAAIVEHGTQEDAQWASYAANRTNALQRSNADKQRAVQSALRHPRGAERSDGDIARHVGVDRQTVSNWRRRLESSGELRQSESRTGADGRTYNVGTKPATPAPQPAPEEEPEEEPEADLEEIAALPATPQPAPAATPAPPAGQLPPRLEMSPAPAPAANGNGQTSEVQRVMMLRVLERAAELALTDFDDVVPPYTIRAELVEEQARQLLKNPAVNMAASMLSLSAKLPEGVKS